MKLERVPSPPNSPKRRMVAVGSIAFMEGRANVVTMAVGETCIAIDLDPNLMAFAITIKEDPYSAICIPMNQVVQWTVHELVP